MDEDDTIDVLKQKVDAGAEFIVTQLFYDSARFIEWTQRVRSRGWWSFQTIEAIS